MMKRTICIRVLTVLLAVCMLWQTVGAVPFSGDWAGTMWSRLLGRWSGDGLETNSTDTAATNAANGTELVYFPVTMYDYDADEINAVTHQMEVDAALAAGGISNLTRWNGMYFNSGTPAAESFVYETGGTESAWVPVSLDEITATGEYVIVNYRTMKAGYISGTGKILATDGQVAPSKGAHVDTGNTAIQRATKWTIEKQDDGNYHIYTGEQYIQFYRKNIQEWDVRVSGSHDDLVIEDAGHGDNSVSIGNGDRYWLNSHDYLGVFSAWDESGENDPGSRFYIYQLKENVSSTDTTDSLPYAEWNFWKKGGDTNRTGQYTYSGLVEPLLSPRKELILTKTDPGLFTTTAVSGKTVYTNVEMPFTFNSETGMYTFDASANGVYFKKDAAQGSTTARSNGRLYFDATGPQSNGGSYGDGSKTVWMPFNSTRTIDGETNCDYHFGMQAVLPFTMTANGRVNPTNPDSEAITFKFSGDDDVWVFIDGILVGDLGGIHNRLNLTLDFAANSWEIWENNDAGENEDPPGFPVDDYNDAALNGKLFNDDRPGAGILGQTRESFAATSEHTLTVFYLERGAGSSNCKIEFNLPMNDTLSVTKRATQSWTDKNNNNEMDEGELSPLTPAEQATVDKISNYYILTKYNAAHGAYEPVANANYNLLDVNGQILSTPATSKDGIFRLSNGQTARFNIELTDKDYYRVEEIIPDNVSDDGSGNKTYLFSYTNWSYSGTAAGGYTYGNTGPDDEREGDEFNELGKAPQAADIPDKGILDPYETINLSNVIAVHGDPGSNDSLEIVCENFLNTTLPNPSARPMNDQIVIDYGLSVEIDVLANDVWRGHSMTLSEVTPARYGTVQIVDNKLVYTLTEQLTVPEVLTYTITVEGDGEIVTRQAKVYIFPATSMYYEEDFGNFVDFSGDWKTAGTAQTEHQEPGVVGTVDDSPYGSDVAYKNDSRDSNGSSKFVDVSNSTASFSYTFTGTGTSFFGRMGQDTGYMKVVIKQGDTVVATYMRNTIYKPTETTGSVLDANGYLYNIPVFTWDAEDNERGYGTYTVEVSIANASIVRDQNGEPIFGGKFFLDGIRVMNPLDTSFEDTEDNRISLAQIAYDTDGEQNMVFATVRDKLISEATVDESGNAVWGKDDNFILFTDNNGQMVNAQDYVSFGPKEEVYLYGGQSVSFALDKWDADANHVFLGIKVPNGSGTVVINGHSLDLSNAADCYFEISDYADVTTNADSTQTATFVIAAADGHLISLTNIKVTGTAEFTIVNNEEIVG